MKISFQRPNPAREPGFTRVELAALLGTVLLLVSIAYPLLAATKMDAARVLCLNNLRQIGQAYAGWKTEHNDAMPQQVDYLAGGTLNNPYRLHAWVYYSVLSNHLATPRPLACPADTAVRIAKDFSGWPGGLSQPAGLGDRAVSYFVGLHGLPEYPSEIVAGDYGLAGLFTETCGVAGVLAWKLDATIPQLGWTNFPHLSVGNVLLNDGRTLSTTSVQLRALALAPGKYEVPYEPNRTHLIIPDR